MPAYTPEPLVFDVSRHQPLAGAPWSAGPVAEAIAAIVEDFETALLAEGRWPTHPLDDPEGRPRWAPYQGAAGALTALSILHRLGYAARDRRELGQEAAESLWKSWFQDPDTGDWRWRSEIFGSVRHYYGACHGLAGNVGALVRAMPEERVRRALARASETLERGALREAGDLNWPVSCDASGTRRLVQWCHGAPGVVTGLAGTPRWREDGWTDTLDALLLGAGELTWRAGPLRKGPGLCHGTAGNGYAFLALYRRTGDARWLERARAFAMHAIRQRRRQRERFGQGRYTLWTGDGGLAVFLHHCLEPAEAAFPGLEIF